MEKSSLAAMLAASLILCASCSKESRDVPTRVITPVNFSEVKITDNFWSERLRKHKEVTLNVCIDQIENKTGRMKNFENAAKGEGEHRGIFFDDSDVYKALEGMAYSLRNNPDPALEAKCDEWIDKFAAAQQSDGYINTYYTLTGLDKRWTEMRKHEMYCAGHLIEAAVAYYNVTGKDKLLNVAVRMADHMMDTFGPDKRHWVPGHEEIELALVKLFETTGERRYLEFAQWLLSERGKGFSVNNEGPEHCQDEIPVEELETISGHAVRAMYLLCGMSDVSAYTDDRFGYDAALERLWDSVVNRNMYITGGIGSTKSNEGFTVDYDLPNLTAYCETCASVGMVLWNWRMNLKSGNAKYADVLERAMYNGVLAGISLAGDRFFYVNPLESLGDHHRKEWYGCACCPSQICRFLPSIGNYIYGTSDDALWVNLYIGSDSEYISQKTDYPWDGDVLLNVNKRTDRDIRLRIPGWCGSWTLKVNGDVREVPVKDGYAVIEGRWRKNDVIELCLDMPVKAVAADPRVAEDRGKRAVSRGPLVYCLEGIDNPDYDDAQLSEETVFDTGYDSGLLCGMQTIEARTGGQVLRFIPYFAWDNREACPMKVWVSSSF